ncbi:MAG TPA: hypothetical protein VEI02_14220, partial [Planctomycetota bacterium]|nr:hypothetical protein [Planctomycetota bacterium]
MARVVVPVLLAAALLGGGYATWRWIRTTEERDAAVALWRETDETLERVKATPARAERKVETEPPAAPSSTRPAAGSDDPAARLAELRRLEARADALAAELAALRAEAATSRPATPAPSAAPRRDATEAALDAELERALGAPDLDAARRRLGAAPFWRVRLEAALHDRGPRALRAVRLLAHLDDSDGATLERALAAAGRLDGPFVFAAAEAWVELRRRRGGDPASLDPATQASAAPARLAALTALAMERGAAAGEATARAAGSPTDGAWLLATWPTGPEPVRAALLAAASAEAAPTAFRLEAIAALAARASADEAAALADLAARTPGAAEALTGRPTSEAARPFLAAAFLDARAFDAATRRFLALALDASVEAPERELRARAWSDRSVVAALGRRARGARPTPPRTAQEAVDLLETFRASDARDLAEALPRLHGTDRVAAARRLAQAAHPAGLATLRESLAVEPLPVRRAAAEALVDAGPEALPDVLRAAGDDDLGIRDAVQPALETSAEPFPPDLA